MPALDRPRVIAELEESMAVAPDTATRVAILNYARSLSPTIASHLSAQIYVHSPSGEIAWREYPQSWHATASTT